MKKEDLYTAIGDMDERILAKCESGWRPSRVWRTVLTTAACLVLAVGIGGAILLTRGGGQKTPTAAQPGANSARTESAAEWSILEPESTAQTAVIPAESQSDQPETAVQEADEESFFALFHELDESSMQSYLDAHPEALAEGWGGIDINESSLTASGTDIRTKNGDQVLAVNVRDGVLLIQVKLANDSRGVLAICKDTSQVRVCPARDLGIQGQTAGEICEENSGVLSMTGSAFLDEQGTGNGGALSGLMIHDGISTGVSLGSGYKRMELREDGKMYVVDADSDIGPGTRDAVEFMPAAIIDGEIVVDEAWNGIQPRALIGQSNRLETMMLVVEGRLPDSIGCGVEDCAELLSQYGCVQALNLDGGTSAILYYKGEYVTRCSNTDLPDGRTLPSAWVYGKAE